MAKLIVLAVISIGLLANVVLAKDKATDKLKYKEKDMMRKSIVFDKHTPDVFYCPMQKPTSFNKLIVRSRPLSKLCEFEGKPLPEEYKSDCYQDVDESDYACKEKYRIMMRKNPPGSDAPYNGARLKRFMDIDKEVQLKMSKVDTAETN